jgi:heat shock protein HspQ
MYELPMKYLVGQVVQHRVFSYRGVIVEAHPYYQHTDDWYEEMAQMRPPKDKPWYRVLVDGTDQVTYVAERNLQVERSGQPVEHPLVDEFFDTFRNGFYSDSSEVN